MTTTTSFPYVETDNPKVLAFRYRSDNKTNRAMAAELRARADELDALGDLEQPTPERTVNALALVRNCAHYQDDWKTARLARYVAATGQSLWHSSWVLHGSRSGTEGCDCAVCKPR